MKTTQNQQAKDLYFGTHKSQREIAEEIGISEKTLYLWIKKGAWDELRTASLAAPAIMVDNFCHMVVELQTYISERPPSNRYPTPQESDCLRKLINNIVKLKEYASTGMNMQVMADFASYIGPDEEFKQKLQLYAEGYFKARKDNERYPNHFAYGVQAPTTNEEEINAISEELEARFGTQEAHTPLTEEAQPTKIFSAAPEIITAENTQTQAHKQFQPVTAIPPKYPLPEKVGNFIKHTASRQTAFIRGRSNRLLRHHIQTHPTSQPALVQGHEPVGQ